MRIIRSTLQYPEKEDSTQDPDEGSRVDFDENAQNGQVEAHRSNAQSQLEAHPLNDPFQDFPSQGTDEKSQSQEGQQGGAIPAIQLHMPYANR
jgi:hypothetical protein